MFALNTHADRFVPALMILAIGLAATQSPAAPVTVPTFSFESPATGNFIASIDSWSGSGDSATAHGVALATANGFSAAADGSQYAFLNLGFSGNTSYQITSIASAIGVVATDTDYTLTVAAGHRSDDASPTTSYVIELLAGGVSMGATTLVDPITEIPNNAWQDIELSISAATAAAFVGDDLQIRLSANGGQQGQFDNVRLDASPASTTIPAPAALPAGLAMIVMASARRRH